MEFIQSLGSASLAGIPKRLSPSRLDSIWGSVSLNPPGGPQSKCTQLCGTIYSVKEGSRAGRLELFYCCTLYHLSLHIGLSSADHSQAKYVCRPDTGPQTVQQLYNVKLTFRFACDMIHFQYSLSGIPKPKTFNQRAYTCFAI